MHFNCENVREIWNIQGIVIIMILNGNILLLDFTTRTFQYQSEDFK